MERISEITEPDNLDILSEKENKVGKTSLSNYNPLPKLTEVPVEEKGKHFTTNKIRKTKSTSDVISGVRLDNLSELASASNQIANQRFRSNSLAQLKHYSTGGAKANIDSKHNNRNSKLPNKTSGSSKSDEDVKRTRSNSVDKKKSDPHSARDMDSSRRESGQLDKSKSKSLGELNKTSKGYVNMYKTNSNQNDIGWMPGDRRIRKGPNSVGGSVY